MNRIVRVPTPKRLPRPASKPLMKSIKTGDAMYAGHDTDHDAVLLGAAVQKYARYKEIPASSVSAAVVLRIAKGLGWRKS